MARIITSSLRHGESTARAPETYGIGTSGHCSGGRGGDHNSASASCAVTSTRQATFSSRPSEMGSATRAQAVSGLGSSLDSGPVTHHTEVPGGPPWHRGWAGSSSSSHSPRNLWPIPEGTKAPERPSNHRITTCHNKEPFWQERQASE